LELNKIKIDHFDDYKSIIQLMPNWNKNYH